MRISGQRGVRSQYLLPFKRRAGRAGLILQTGYDDDGGPGDGVNNYLMEDGSNYLMEDGTSVYLLE